MTRDLRTRAQLLSDLASAKMRCQMLTDGNENLEKRVRSAEQHLRQALVEAKDWREAFKLIMRLVK